MATPLDPFLRSSVGPGGGRSRARFTVRPEPARELTAVDGLLAGAVAVDITPPPGMPKAGYSANMSDWTGPALPFAVNAVKEFEQTARQGKSEPRTAA